MKNTQTENKPKQDHSTEEKKQTKQTHLTKEERAEQILEAVRLVNEEKKTLKQVAEILNMKSPGNVGKALGRAGYVREGKKYILQEEVEESKEENNSDNVTDSDRLKDVIKMLKDMDTRLSKLETENKKGIMVSNEHMNYKAFSIRADESIMNDFDELSKTFSNVSKSYLLSMALKEFVAKYSAIS